MRGSILTNEEAGVCRLGPTWGERLRDLENNEEAGVCELGPAQPGFFLFVILLACLDGIGAIDLLQKNQPRHVVGKSHF